MGMYFDKDGMPRETRPPEQSPIGEAIWKGVWRFFWILVAFGFLGGVRHLVGDENYIGVIVVGLPVAMCLLVALISSANKH